MAVIWVDGCKRGDGTFHKDQCCEEVNLRRSREDRISRIFSSKALKWGRSIWNHNTWATLGGVLQAASAWRVQLCLNHQAIGYLNIPAIGEEGSICLYGIEIPRSRVKLDYC